MIKSSHTLRTGEGRPTSWQDFKNFNSDFEFEDGHPEEEAIVTYFKHLRLEKKWQRHQFGHTTPTPTSTVS